MVSERERANEEGYESPVFDVRGSDLLTSKHPYCCSIDHRRISIRVTYIRCKRFRSAHEQTSLLMLWH